MYKLKDGESSRWGGFGHEFEKTAQEWKEDYKKTFPDQETPFDKCYVCGQEPPQDQPLYVGAFELKPGRFQFKIMCKECAYKISEIVAEPKEA